MAAVQGRPQARDYIYVAHVLQACAPSPLHRGYNLPMLAHVRLMLWRIGALTAVALGIIGIAVPGLPTVPFLILAAFAGGKGWPALERWLLAHPVHGPHIRNWRERGSVPRKAKIAAVSMMLASAALLQLAPVAAWLRLGIPLAMLPVALWLCSRPEK